MRPAAAHTTQIGCFLDRAVVELREHGHSRATQDRPCRHNLDNDLESVTYSMVYGLDCEYIINVSQILFGITVVDRGVGDWGSGPGHQGRGHQRREGESKNNCRPTEEKD